MINFRKFTQDTRNILESHLMEAATPYTWSWKYKRDADQDWLAMFSIGSQKVYVSFLIDDSGEPAAFDMEFYGEKRRTEQEIAEWSTEKVYATVLDIVKSLLTEKWNKRFWGMIILKGSNQNKGWLAYIEKTATPALKSAFKWVKTDSKRTGASEVSYRFYKKLQD